MSFSEAEIRQMQAQMSDEARDASLFFAVCLMTERPSSQDDLMKGLVISCAKGLAKNGWDLKYDTQRAMSWMESNIADVFQVGLAIALQSGKADPELRKKAEKGGWKNGLKKGLLVAGGIALSALFG
jgi:hypothetical protein